MDNPCILRLVDFPIKQKEREANTTRRSPGSARASLLLTPLGFSFPELWFIGLTYEVMKSELGLHWASGAHGRLWLVKQRGEKQQGFSSLSP